MTDREAPVKVTLDEALAEAPRGALALAGVAVALLVVAWCLVYLFIFLPRGQVT